MSDDQSLQGSIIINQEQKKYIIFLLLLAFIGVASMILGNREPKQVVDDSPSLIPETSISTQSELITDEERLAADLTEALEAVKGVGKVVVKVTLATTTETEYAQENQMNQTTISETNQNGSTKSTDETRQEVKLVMKNQNQGSNEPVIIKQNRPQVVGVVVVAEGADDLIIKSQIANAVQVLLDVPPHKVTVLPKAKEE